MRCARRAGRSAATACLHSAALSKDGGALLPPQALACPVPATGPRNQASAPLHRAVPVPRRRMAEAGCYPRSPAAGQCDARVAGVARARWRLLGQVGGARGQRWAAEAGGRREARSCRALLRSGEPRAGDVRRVPWRPSALVSCGPGGGDRPFPVAGSSQRLKGGLCAAVECRCGAHAARSCPAPLAGWLRAVCWGSQSGLQFSCWKITTVAMVVLYMHT